jgi:hypothetical protein
MAAPTPTPDSILEAAKAKYEESNVSLASLVPFRFQENREFMSAIQGVLVSDVEATCMSLADLMPLGSAKLTTTIFQRRCVADIKALIEKHSST